MKLTSRLIDLPTPTLRALRRRAADLHMDLMVLTITETLDKREGPTDGKPA